MNVPYYYRSVDFDRLVREYPPSQDYAETVFLHDRRQIAEVQNRRFVSIVESAWRNPFYRKRWEAHGLRPQDIRSMDDLGKLPMVAVEDFKDSIKAHPPFGEHPGLSRAAGAVRFRTIYPGWYSGRTTHVHLKLRVGAKAVTTQLYFPDEVTNAVYARAPYDRHPNRDTTNATDRFVGQIADKSLVTWTMARDGDGYVAAATVALRTS